MIALANSVYCMIHELRDPSYCPKLGTFLKNFLLIFSFFGYLTCLLKDPTSQSGKHFFL